MRTRTSPLAIRIAKLMKAILISQHDPAFQDDAADIDERGRHDDLAHPDSLRDAQDLPGPGV